MVKSKGGVAPAAKTERNAEVLAGLRSGVSGAALAREYGITRQRVHQLRRNAERTEATGTAPEAPDGHGGVSGP